MIRLKNVKKENNRIYADYFPEDSSESKRISLNVDDFSDFQGELVGDEMETRNHLAHAKFALIDMVEGEREINDCLIMWY